jgi:hypothetical protein
VLLANPQGALQHGASDEIVAEREMDHSQIVEIAGEKRMIRSEAFARD